MFWKGLVKVTFPSHLQTLMALFPKSKVLKGQVSRSGHRTNMPDLLKESEFVWEAQQEAALVRVKDTVTKNPVLAFYDPSKELMQQGDAAEKATGATLMQEGRPIEYASRALDASKQNWAPIEREMFANVHGCKRLHQYLYGRRTMVESDHRPLEAFMKKPLSSVLKRLQSMILELQRYRYDLKVVHKPGKEIPVTDCLSRNLVKDAKPIPDEFSTKPDVAVHQLIATLPLSDQRLAEIRTKTSTDQNLQVLKHFILTGWPNQRKDCPTTIMEHWNHQDELVYQDDIIFKGDRIVIPKEMHPEMLMRVHEGHLGIE